MFNAAALGNLADELGRLEAELAPFKSTITRVDAIRKALRASFASASPGSEHNVTGSRYGVHVGACGYVSVVDRPALVERIGLGMFSEIATASLKAIEAHCGADVLAAVITIEQAGPRPVVVSELPKPALPAVALASAVKTADAVSSRPKKKKAA